MFGSLMGDNFDDMFGSHMRRMHDAMNSFFGNPFGGDMMGPPQLGMGSSRSPSTALMPFQQQLSGSPFPFLAFPNHMNQLMRNVGHNMMSNNANNCHSYSSSTVVSMTTGPDGKPQVYRASSSTSTAPGGIRETKKSVCDSRTGVKKMAIGRHIGDRAHIQEKERNMYSGEVEENEEYVNLDEEEAPEFNNEWQSKTRQFRSPNAPQAIGYRYPSHSRNDVRECLALPPAPSSEREERRSKSPQKKKSHRSQPYNKRKAKKSAE